jgi:hypothetical protein
MKLVRHRNGNGGPCAVLGEVVRETETMYWYKPYRDANMAYISKRVAGVHCDSCTHCVDHPQSRYPMERD